MPTLDSPAASSWNPSIIGLRFQEAVMNASGEGRAGTTKIIHCWDPQARRMICGSAGQSGSTKHVRAVTCGTCLELLGRPSRPLLSVIRRE